MNSVQSLRVRLDHYVFFQPTLMAQSKSTRDDLVDTTLIRTLEGHSGVITRLSWAPSGASLASAGQDGVVRIWDVDSGQLLSSLRLPGLHKSGRYWLTRTGESATAWNPSWSRDGGILACGYGDGVIRLWNWSLGTLAGQLEAHTAKVNNVAWSPDGTMLASAADDNRVNLWDIGSSAVTGTLLGHRGGVNTIAWHPSGRLLASASLDGTIRIWNVASRETVAVLSGHQGFVITVIWSPDGNELLSTSRDCTVRLWDPITGKRLRILEGHSAPVSCAAYSADGSILATKAIDPDGTVRLWRTGSWDIVTTIQEPSSSMWFAGIAFHSSAMLLATLGNRDRGIRIWQLDLGRLADHRTVGSAHQITAKVVVVGESGVGKTGLASRIARGFFKEHPSTHGQQSWVIRRRADISGAVVERELAIWDLAGQPDYRLVHALFLGDVDLAVVVVDPTTGQESLDSAVYWANLLKARNGQMPPSVLVGARIDRGSRTLSSALIHTFCQENQITGGYYETSARTGEGVQSLVDALFSLITWDRLTINVTVPAVLRSRTALLALKQRSVPTKSLISLDYAVEALTQSMGVAPNTDDVMLAAKSLQRHGNVTLLSDSSGSQLILLAPEVLSNVAASIVLAARRHPDGLGCLDENMLFRFECSVPELVSYSDSAKNTLLNAASSLLIRGNSCFRQTVGDRTFIVFPSLITEAPQGPDANDIVEDTLYSVSGAIENLFASLVVLLGYTNTFIRTQHWRRQAEYELGPGQVCGFRQSSDGAGTLELIVYHQRSTPDYCLSVFRGLLEKFLGDKPVTVRRYPIPRCTRCSDPIETAVVKKQLARRRKIAFCCNCGTAVQLVEEGEPSSLSRDGERSIILQKDIANRRTCFEAALVWIKSYLLQGPSDAKAPSCFISYAWGVPEHEQWIMRLAKDLRNAGIQPIVDKWHCTPGTSMVRFIENITYADYVIAVGTPAYSQKYSMSAADAVVEAELRLIGSRLMKGQSQRGRIIPALLAGNRGQSFPPQFSDSVFVDFRLDQQYFVSLFDLILTLLSIPFDHPRAEQFRQELLAASV